MKIRMFSKLLLVLSLFIPSLSYSAIAFENYQSLVVPQPRWYPNHGFFTSYFLGINDVSTFNLSPDALSEISMRLDGGYYGGMALGYRNKNFRIEEELSIRYNGVDAYESLPMACGQFISHGPVIVTSLMTNIYWDFLMGNYIMPFIGVGAGGAFLVNSTSETSTGADFTQNAVGYAFQGVLGMGIMLNFRNEIDIFYKYYRANFIEYTNTVFNCDTIGLLGQDIGFTPKYTANSIVIEWRISP